MITEFQGPFRFLSNFWPCKVEYEGIIYPSIEHAYQAAKCDNPFDRQTVFHAKTPGKAKRMGQLISLRPDWEDVKMGIMFELLHKKFQDLKLRKQLLDTGEAKLEEGNRWGDEFWGVNLKTGRGKNWLGVLLMRVRNELRSEK
jgi:ribA/ribD-fused uncharacterized protein